MKREAVRQKVFNFLNNHELGILSTIHADKDAPESAVVGFGNNENLELIFGTLVEARKYRNLLKNPQVALVIGWSSITGSLQYEGIARELSREEIDRCAHLLIVKNEDHRRFLAQLGQRYFLVTPTWIRFYDNAGEPPDVYELEF